MSRLAELRAERGWKKARLVLELRAAATRHGQALPKDDSLLRRIAAWENQRGAVSDFYRNLLCEVYSTSAVDLGLEPTGAGPTVLPPVEDVGRVTLSRLDQGLVELLRGQTQSLRMLDRRLGATTLFRQTAAHVDQLEQLVRYALPGAHRAAAADELAQAAALAGWQALDMGQVEQAWRLHETAKAAAREGGNLAVLAHVSAQQAYVLLDMNRPREAWAVAQGVREQHGRAVPPLLNAWLQAAEGEFLAALGDRNAALRSLDGAADALPSHAGDPDLPFLMLDEGHLARWRGHCLARLGEQAAIVDLTVALDIMSAGQYGRAEAALRVDLAVAFRARGDVGEAQLHAQRAADLARQTGSQRQRRRISRLLAA